MRRVASSLIVALALGGAGCGGATAITDGVLSLGGTAVDGSGFVPLTGDQELVSGSQGGFHVWLKFRIRGMQPEPVTVRRTARRISDNRLLLQAEGPFEVGAANDAGTWELPSPIPTFLCPSPLGVDIIGQPVRFRVELAGPSGAMIDVAESNATPRCPTDNQAPFCQQICSGR